MILLLALLNAYAASGIILRWPAATDNAAVAWACVFFFFLLQLSGPFGDHTVFPKLKRKYKIAGLLKCYEWLSYLAFGIASILFVYALIADTVSLFAGMFMDQTTLDRYGLIALVTATAATTLLGLWNVHTGPFVRKVDVPLENLPAGFDGFTIAQISDLHVGPTIGRDYTRKVVGIANNLKPDTIALTGDFIDGPVSDLAPEVAPLADLKAPHGTYFITGNHEYYWNAFAWEAEFKKLGATVLTNEHKVIRRNDDAIVVAGVTDIMTVHMDKSFASDPAKAIAGAPPDLVKILLAHQPASCEAAAKAGFDLQLSGHTHSGQYFPYTFLIRYFQRFYKGLNRYRNMWVYVNVGTGYWGPPLRTAPSEITLLTLRKAVEKI